MAQIIDTSRKILLTQRLKHYVDVNTDFGQTQDKAFFEKEDYKLLNFVSSVNVPCFVHDGDPWEIRKAIRLAKAYHCTVSAHIGYPDPANFGYSPMDISDDELISWIYVQMGAIQAIGKAENIEIIQVRPHGALYSVFLEDYQKARRVAEALVDFNRWMILIGPSGPILQQISQEVGIRIAPEIYLGKRYSAEGILQRHSFRDALYPQGIVDQVKQLLTDGSLTSSDGRKVPMTFKSLHLSPKLESVSDVAEKIFKLLGQPVALPIAAVGESGWV